jgi:hypothetical protein
LATYLRRITMNLSLNALKRRRRMTWRFPSRDRSPEPLPEPQTDPGEADGWEVREHLQAAIARLAPRHRSVVVLRMMQGCSTREAEFARTGRPPMGPGRGGRPRPPEGAPGPPPPRGAATTTSRSRRPGTPCGGFVSGRCFTRYLRPTAALICFVMDWRVVQ